MKAFKYETIISDILRGNMENLDSFLRSGGQVDLRNPRNQQTLLMSAVQNGYFKDEAIINLLLKHGANLEATCDLGYTPLMYAAMHTDGEPNFLKLLIKKGANIEYTTSRGNVLTVALSRATSKIADALVEFDFNVKLFETENFSPLSFACFNGNLNVAQKLLEKGASVNGEHLNFSYQNKGECVPPIWACLRGICYSGDCTIEIFNLLTQSNADPTICDRDGMGIQDYIKRTMRNIDLPPAFHAYYDRWTLHSQTKASELNRTKPRL